MDAGRRHRLQRTGAALLSATFMVLTCPAFDYWWFGFVAWVPWLWSFEGSRPRHAFLYGWLTGIVTVFWGFFWLTDLLERFASFPTWLAAIVALVFAMWQGLLWGFPAAIICFVRQRTDHSVLYVAPLAWVAVEALLPNIFPVYMGLAWTAEPLLLQVAELGGPTTVACFAVAINAALYVALGAALRERRTHKLAIAVGGALIAFVVGYGMIRMAQVDALIERSPKLRIGVVQGNMGINEARFPENKPIILAKHQRMSKELQAQGAELILWGETSYPYYWEFERDTTHEPPVGSDRRLHAGFDVPLLTGAITSEDSEDSPFPWNSALLLDGGGDGRVVSRYDKVFLLVFGEYIPLFDPQWFMAKVPGTAHLNRGTGPGVIEHGDLRLGALICYEDILPRFVRDTANLGVHAFVNLTNDAWFGDTAEPSQHLGLAITRTIEHRRGLLRAVNTGISTYVDPNGRVIHRTEVTDPDIQGPQDPDGFVAEVPMIAPGADRTPYAIIGEGFNGAAIVGIVLLAFVRRRREEAAA